MKNFLKSPVLLLLLIIYLVFGCAKDEEKPKTKPTEPVVTYNISGRVVDTNAAPISGAKVKYVSGAISDETTTDASGLYRFQNLTIGVYTIDVTKSGYTFGKTFAEVTEDGSNVTAVVLKNLTVIEERVEEQTTVEDIQKSGYSIESEIDTEVSVGGTNTETVKQKANASIPAGTKIKVGGQDVSGAISLAVTPLEIDEVPPAPEDEMSIGSVIFEPENATFDKPVAVKLPLEIKLPEGLQVPVKKYEDGEWREIGTATIDESGLGVDAEVQEFGQIAVQPDLRVDTESSDPVETEGETTEIPEGQNVVEVDITNTIEFTQGLPEGVTTEYAVSLIEKLKGIKAGESAKLLLELPSVSKVALAAKTTSPFSADEAEIWKQTCNIVIIDIVTTETITIVIDLGGTTYTFAIEFTYTSQKATTECTREWIEHGQGEI